MLLDLRPADLVQQELTLDDEVTDPGGSRLMQALDAVNQKFGRNTLSLASAGLTGMPRQWCMKQERRTPGYTTDWDGLALVRA
jgi:DNA polymerase V